MDVSAPMPVLVEAKIAGAVDRDVNNQATNLPEGHHHDGHTGDLYNCVEADTCSLAALNSLPNSLNPDSEPGDSAAPHTSFLSIAYYSPSISPFISF